MEIHENRNRYRIRVLERILYRLFIFYQDNELKKLCKWGASPTASFLEAQIFQVC